jgi:hypothetical protein
VACSLRDILIDKPDPGRRDEIQHAIERLKGSPADQAAPAKAVALEADLESVNLEIRRLTVVLGEPDVSSQ